MKRMIVLVAMLATACGGEQACSNGGCSSVVNGAAQCWWGDNQPVAASGRGTLTIDGHRCVASSDNAEQVANPTCSAQPAYALNYTCD